MRGRSLRRALFFCVCNERAAANLPTSFRKLSPEEGSQDLPDLGGPDRYGGNKYGRGRFAADIKKPRRRGVHTGLLRVCFALGREDLATLVTVTADGGLLPKSTVTHRTS